MNLKINHRLGIADVKFFNNFTLNLKYDSIASTFAFDFYFDPKNKQHAELACVSHFHEAIVEHNGETVVTGYILSQIFNTSSKKELTQFGGYSKPGVLEDCEIPIDLYPLQSDGLTFNQIAQKLIVPFGLKMKIDSSVAYKMNTVIPVTTSSETDNIKSYLTEMAIQRDILITHDEFGNLLFTKAKTDLQPLFHIEDGLIGTSMSMNFNGQSLHSDITVMKQASSDGGNAGQYTIQNPYVPIVYRPKTITQSSGDDITTEQAAKNALAAELKNITLTIELDRWDIDGKIIRPNNIISVYNPELFIYKKTNWFIESVNLTGDSQKLKSTITCVLPEVYNGKTPANIFVDPHKNLPRF